VALSTAVVGLVFIDRHSSVDIPIAEGPVNLNWGQIMKTINDSPYEFFQTGGWGFLGGTGDDVGIRFNAGRFKS
jgi:nucleosome binding factor SPN SPT16 subunit